MAEEELMLFDIDKDLMTELELETVYDEWMEE